MDDGVEEIQSILSEVSNGGRKAEEIPVGGEKDTTAAAAEQLQKDATASEGNEENTGGGTSIIKTLISTILHPNNGGGEGEGEGEGEGGDDKGVHNPKGDLPATSNTIGEVAPAAEEASLLIHSIVHD